MEHHKKGKKKVSENKNIREELNGALKTAMKAKDKVMLSTVRLVLAALKDRDLAARGKGDNAGLSDNDILSMLQTMIKQRAESSATYRKADRPELAEREETEIAIIRSFLPVALEGDELSAIIQGIIEDTGAESIRDMGKIMGVLKTKYAGQVDMGQAGSFVKEKLG